MEEATSDDSISSSLSELRVAIDLMRSNDYLPSIILLSIVSSFAIGPIGIVMPFYIEAITTPTSIVFGGLYASFFLGMFFWRACDKQPRPRARSWKSNHHWNDFLRIADRSNGISTAVR